ncbi:hypothetical protein EYZ11_010398 [Aspergillus tanneri]|uniref:HDA1 complex subunit n=1 Tax=Aspergillus tanneri TaxID=1220188 RepID=A0A4V6RQP6_9EURO|nr:hypothetical protein EYZ11_010398 [Aspergillus tanneri]
MEKYSHYEGATPREKLRSAYAQLTARASAGPSQNVDVSATPSSAGDIEPSAPPPVPEATAPLSRFRNQSQDQLDWNLLNTLLFKRFNPVHLRVKDDYERVVASESHSIREFLRISDPREESAENELERLEPKIRDVLKHLSNVATHPDLNINDHIKDSRSDLAKEAAWAEYSSAKFLFLAYVVEIASSRDIHIVILVDEEKTQDVVERYLKGKGLVYTRPREEMGIGTNQEVSMTRDCLSFGIQSSRNDGVMETYKRPSAIVALDSSFNAKNPSVEHMRTTYARNGSLLPVIRLIVASSSEHVELCFPNLAEIQQLRLVVYYTMQLRDLVGDLQDDALGVREDVEEILSSLLSDNFEYHWPLPLIEPLHIVSSKELGSLRIGGLNEANAGSAPPLRALSQKRGIEVEGTNEQVSKRFRPGVSQDASQFTDGSNVQSQTLDRDLQTLEKHLIQMRASHAAERESLRESLAAAESRLLEREKVLESLQHRYESRTKNLHQIRQERDRLVESNTASEQRIQRQKEEIGKLKDERTQLRHDLESARERLKTGGGTAAELESSQEEIRRLTKENAALQRKAEYESKQTEYTREQYQTASTAAAQSGNESRQLREENETLKRKVAADVSRLKELNMKNEESRHLARIAELETTLSNRDDLLRRKEEELREIRKNRPSTRSTSTQPRSPKWTAGNSRPTSPGINNNGSTFAGRGSALRFSSEMSL